MGVCDGSSQQEMTVYLHFPIVKGVKVRVGGDAGFSLCGGQ